MRKTTVKSGRVDEVFINLKVSRELKDTLKTAKRVTGASMKFLVTESVFSKYAQFRPREAA